MDGDGMPAPPKKKNLQVMLMLFSDLDDNDEVDHPNQKSLFGYSEIYSSLFVRVLPT